MSKRKNAAKRIAVLAIFTALSLIMFLIENLFPPLFIPGAKMGLSNIFSFAALLIYGPAEAFAVIAVRTLLGAVFAGNLSALIYSFTGGIAAMALSSILVYTVYPRISIMAVSIAAAVVHNITQNIVFVLISQTPLMFSYMPYLALIGVLSGAIVGGAVMLIFKKVPSGVFERVLGRKKVVIGAENMAENMIDINVENNAEEEDFVGEGVRSDDNDQTVGKILDEGSSRLGEKKDN